MHNLELSFFVVCLSISIKVPVHLSQVRYIYCMRRQVGTAVIVRDINLRDKEISVRTKEEARA
jgi:hypothetical protein